MHHHPGRSGTGVAAMKGRQLWLSKDWQQNSTLGVL